MNRKEIYFIRHGLTKSNMEHRYLGRTDESLCEQGINSLEKFNRAEIDLVFSGPMKRCIETKEILFGCANSHTIDAWTEIDFGDFELKTYQELDGNSDYQAWIDSGGIIAFPGGESRESFIARSMSGLDSMWDTARDKASNRLAAVVHGGNIMAILSSITGGDYFDFQVKPGHGYRCVVEFNQGYKLIEIEEI